MSWLIREGTSDAVCASRGVAVCKMSLVDFTHAVNCTRVHTVQVQVEVEELHAVEPCVVSAGRAGSRRRVCGVLQAV